MQHVVAPGPVRIGKRQYARADRLEVRIRHGAGVAARPARPDLGGLAKLRQGAPAGDLWRVAAGQGESLGRRLGVTEADVDGQVGEDVRHLGAVAQVHRGAVAARSVRHAGRVGDARRRPTGRAARGSRRWRRRSSLPRLAVASWRIAARTTAPSMVPDASRRSTVTSPIERAMAITFHPDSPRLPPSAWMLDVLGATTATSAGIA